MLIQTIQKQLNRPMSSSLATKGGSASLDGVAYCRSALKAGQRVATIDLDLRQQSFWHAISIIAALGLSARTKLEVPTHYCIARAEGNSLERMRRRSFQTSAAISAIEHSHDVVVIDTWCRHVPMRLAHSMADTLVTPLNDSFRLRRSGYA